MPIFHGGLIGENESAIVIIVPLKPRLDGPIEGTALVIGRA